LNKRRQKPHSLLRIQSKFKPNNPQLILVGGDAVVVVVVVGIVGIFVELIIGIITGT